MSSNLEGRVAVVFGVANKRSIAWAIAQGLHAAGAKLAVTYHPAFLLRDRRRRSTIAAVPRAFLRRKQNAAPDLSRANEE